MKLTQYLLAGWALWACLAGCKHDPDPGPATESPTEQVGESTPGKSTAIGEPQGEAISNVIGPEGGTLSSADGLVQLTLPAGALSKTTTISIQPITNQAPNGLGLAYRFSPDGTQFDKPALLTFRYAASAVAVNDPALLRVAFQDASQRWKRVSGVSADTANHELTVPMAHFSDWSAYELAKIELLDINGGPAGGKHLEFGETTTLTVLKASDVEPLQPIGNELNLVISTVTWSVAGGSANGRISVTDGKATYTAPSAYPPQNPVTAVAELTFQNSPKKVLLLKKMLIGADYFTGTFGGVPFDWANMYYQPTNNTVLLSGWNDAPRQSLNVILFSSRMSNPTGSYRYIAGPPTKNGQAFAEFAQAYDGKSGFLTYLYPCGKDDPPPIISGGQVVITQTDFINGHEYIKGYLSATLYNLDGPCPRAYTEKPIKAEFRIQAIL